MQIPFAGAVLGRLGRREAGLELIEEIEDEAVESVDAADLLSAEPALLLQRMENRLIRHHLANPEVLSTDELRKLRSPMSAVMAAMQVPTGRFARWRNRHLT
jgi:hypothetical protein